MKNFTLALLILLSLPLTAQDDTLTVAETYDFKVGDEFHYNMNEYVYPLISRRKILNKWYSAQEDTVFYEYHEFGYQLINLNLDDTVYDWIATYKFFDDTIVEYYTDLEKKIYQYNDTWLPIPHESVGSIPESDSNGCVSYDTSSGMCSYAYTFNIESVCDSQVLTNRIYVHHGEGTYGVDRTYGKGRGVIKNRVGGAGGDYLLNQKYYKSNGFECGTPDNLSGVDTVTFYEGIHEDSLLQEELDINQPLVFNLYPNPIQDELHLELEEFPCTVTIRDATGHLVYEKVYETHDAVFTDFLESGLYYVHFKSENKEAIRTVVKE